MTQEHASVCGPFRLETPGRALVARRPPDALASALSGDVALSGRTSRPPEDQSRGAAARVGRHTWSICATGAIRASPRGLSTLLSRDGGMEDRASAIWRHF